MLLDLLLNIVYSVVSWFVGLIPDASISPGLAESIAGLNGYLAGISFVAPVTTIIIILSLFLVLESSLVFISIINWFIRKIPGIN